MLPQLKYFKVNWVDGMKITKDHFLQLEDAINDQIRDMAAVSLTNYNYGLLPPGPNAKQSVDVQLFFDRSEQVNIKVTECRAITPGGVRIDITPSSPAIEVTIPVDRLKTQAYEIYITVNPFARMAFGQPNPNESPLRQPFTLPQYGIEVLPYPYTHLPGHSAFQVCVGRLRIEGEQVRLSEHYIPPCTSLMSHSRLVAYHQKLLTQLGESEIALTGISQRIRAKKTRTDIDQSLLYITEKLTDYLALSLDNFKHILLQQTPLQLVTYFASMARVINLGLNSLVRSHREELLEYFHKWSEISPREMENLLRSLLTLSYDHNDSFSSLNKVETFISSILALLKKLNELEYSQKPVEQEKIYGWLAVHTENRPRQIYKIKERSILIGRMDGNSTEVDFAIHDDDWVSRRHAKLTIYEEGGDTMFQLLDLNSNNGTYIHDTQTRLKPNQDFSLIDGDTFQLGKTNIVIKSAANIATEKEFLSQIDRIPYQKISNIKELVG